MRTTHARTALLAALLVAVSALGCSKARRADSVAHKVAPVASSDIIFSHAKHVEEEVECGDCHEGVDGATSLDKAHLPQKAACGECHEVDDKDECNKCHRNVKKPGGLARRPSTPKLVFSHKAHLGRGAECVTCHASAMVSSKLASIGRPRMKQECFSCHNHLDDYRALRCKDCHESLVDFPIKFVSQFNHEGDFVREHGRWAHSQQDLCETCHRQSYCADCHSQRAVVRPSVKLAEKVDRRFIHRGDWISRHSVASRADPQSCMRCHSNKSCDSCHSARGVSATAGAGRSRSLHPPDWLNPASPNSHGVAARRSIVQCAGCHDQGSQSNCIQCHKTRERGGVGINPHPPGWDRGGAKSNAMCKLCH